MSIYWHISDQLQIPLYNLFVGFGLVAGFLYLDWEFNRRGLSARSSNRVINTLIWTGFAAMIGAKTFELLYKSQGLTFSNFLNGGQTFYGGFVCGALCFMLLTALYGGRIAFHLNLVIPSVILGHAFGRIGCHLVGCCFGRPTTCPVFLTVSAGSVPAGTLAVGTHIHPVQLYESIFLFGLFALVAFIVKFEWRMITYLVVYGAARFALEYLRGDFRGKLVSDVISPSQVISLSLFVVGAGFAVRKWRRNLVRPAA